MRLAAGRPRWWIGFALTDLPSLPFSAGAIMYGPVLYRPGARSRAFHDLSAFLLSREGACTCRGSRAVDSIRHDAWSSWIAGGFMKSSALGRARAAATCADDGPLSLGLLSWLCVACDAARGTREGLAARRMRDRLRYHAGSRVRRGQPLGAEVLLAVPTAGRNPFRGTASCLLARARALSTLPRPTTQTSVTVTGLKSTKNEPTAQH